MNALAFHAVLFQLGYSYNKKHLKTVGPIRHCEPLHCHSPGVATVARRLRIDDHNDDDDDDDNNDNDNALWLAANGGDGAECV